MMAWSITVESRWYQSKPNAFDAEKSPVWRVGDADRGGSATPGARQRSLGTFESVSSLPSLISALRCNSGTRTEKISSMEWRLSARLLARISARRASYAWILDRAASSSQSLRSRFDQVQVHSLPVRLHCRQTGMCPSHLVLRSRQGTQARSVL